MAYLPKGIGDLPVQPYSFLTILRAGMAYLPKGIGGWKER